MSRIINHLRTNKFYVLMWLACFLFFLLMPYNGDDYGFFSSQVNSGGSLLSLIGDVRWMYENMNGRILGNFLPLLLTYYPPVLAVVSASVVVGIIKLITKLCDVPSPFLRNLVAIAVIFIPLPVFGEIYGWKSGFLVYAPPTLLLLLMLRIFQKWMEEGREQLAARRPVRVAGVFFLYLAASLFLENVTIIAGVLALGWMVASFLNKGRDMIEPLFALIGAIVGGSAMASASGYRTIQSTDSFYSGYRSIETTASGLVDVVRQNISSLAQFITTGTGMVLIIILVVTLILIITKTRQQKKEQLTVVDVVVTAMLLATIVVLPMMNGIAEDGGFSGHEATFVAALFLLSLTGIVTGAIYVIFRITNDAENRLVLLALLLTCFFLLAPVLIVQPIGPRTVYPSYILMVAFAGYTASFLMKNSPKSVSGAFYRPSSVALGMTAIIFIAMAGYIRHTEIKNFAYAREQVRMGESTVILVEYPFKQLMHAPDETEKLKKGILAPSESCPNPDGPCQLSEIGIRINERQ